VARRRINLAASLLAFWLAADLILRGHRDAGSSPPRLSAPHSSRLLPWLGSTPCLQHFFDNHHLVGTVGGYNGEAAFLLVPFWVAVYLAFLGEGDSAAEPSRSSGGLLPLLGCTATSGRASTDGGGSRVASCAAPVLPYWSSSSPVASPAG
jgi:hypothetical protein